MIVVSIIGMALVVIVPFAVLYCAKKTKKQTKTASSWKSILGKFST